MQRRLHDHHPQRSYYEVMITEAFFKLHHTRPFQAFSLRLGDGQSLPVEHPEMLAYAPKSRTATVYRKDGSFEIVDLLLVTGLDVRPPSNGRRSSTSR